MEENITYYVTLKDGTSFYATSDGVGNLICASILSQDIFSDDNISQVTISANGIQSIYYNQVLRTFYYQDNGTTFIRLDEKTELQKLKSETELSNQMLIDCLLEISETLYA